MRLFIRLHVGLATLLVASLSSAQPMGEEDHHPKSDFYPKNFVHEQAPSKNSSQQIPQSAPATARTTPTERPSDIVPMRRDQPLATDPAVASQATSPLGRHRTTPSGVVYVNSMNKEHISQVCDKVLSLRRQGKIRINVIMHYGNYEHVSEQQAALLLQHGIHMIELPELPSDLPLSQSPAWLMYDQTQTPDDKSAPPHAYLVQGYFNIELFFDQYGAFAVPAGMKAGMMSGKGNDRDSGNLAGF